MVKCGTAGPAMIRNENGLLSGYVYVDMERQAAAGQATTAVMTGAHPHAS